MKKFLVMFWLLAVGACEYAPAQITSFKVKEKIDVGTSGTVIEDDTATFNGGVHVAGDLTVAGDVNFTGIDTLITPPDNITLEIKAGLTIGITEEYLIDSVGAAIGDSLDWNAMRVLNIKGYGADGDSSTNADDSTAWVAVYAVAGTGDVIYFPKGDYDFSTANLTIAKPIYLSGAGQDKSIIYGDTSEATQYFKLQSDFFAKDVKFEQWYNVFQYDKTIKDTLEFSVENVNFEYLNHWAMITRSGSDSLAISNLRWINSNVKNCGNGGLFLEMDIHNMHVESSDFINIYDSVANSGITYDVVAGVFVGWHDGSSVNYSTESGNFIITDCIFDSIYSDLGAGETCEVHAINVYGYNLQITNNVIKNISMENNHIDDSEAFYVVGEIINIDGNTFHNAGSKPSGIITIKGGNSTETVVIQNNIIYNDTYDFSGAGIYMTKGGHILNNTIRILNSSIAIAAIRLQTPETVPRKYLIKGNSIENEHGKAIQITSDTAATYIIRDNPIIKGKNEIIAMASGNGYISNFELINNGIYLDSLANMNFRAISGTCIIKDNTIYYDGTAGTGAMVFTGDVNNVSISENEIHISETSTVSSILFNVSNTGFFNLLKNDIYIHGRLAYGSTVASNMQSINISHNNVYFDTLNTAYEMGWFTRINSDSVFGDIILNENKIIGSDSLTVDYFARITCDSIYSNLIMKDNYLNKYVDKGIYFINATGGVAGKTILKDNISDLTTPGNFYSSSYEDVGELIRHGNIGYVDEISASFTTTETGDTTVISGVTTSSIFQVWATGQSVNANDVLSVTVKTDSLIVTRPSSGTSNLPYKYLRLK